MRTFDPFREVDLLRREVERLFDSYSPVRIRRGAFLPGRAARSYPLVNISEDSDHVTIEALAPGVDPESWELSIQEGNLVLSGEKTIPAKDITPEAWHRNERAAGRFLRTIKLPSEVDPDKVEAEYKNGILNIRIAKAEAAKPRKIQVSVA